MTERPVNLLSSLKAILHQVGLATLILICLAVMACKSGYPAASRQDTENNTPPRRVKTASVVEMPVGQTVTVNGTLAAYDHTTVSVKVFPEVV